MKLALLFLLLAVRSFAAIASTAVWEIQTGGDNTNGGGYVSGGTDYSQSTTPITSVTDGVAAGTTTITSATASFTAAMVGNIMSLEGGTGTLTRTRRQITGFTNSTTVTVDASVAAGTGITVKVGGCLATVAEATTSIVAGNDIYIKAGTYTHTATWTQNVAGTIGAIIRWIGYDTNRTYYNTDTMPLITQTTTTTTLLTVSGANFNIFRNLSFSNTTGGTKGAFLSSSAISSPVTFDRCIFDGFTTAIITAPTNSATPILNFCEIKNCTSHGVSMGGASVTISNSYIHDNGGDGINNGNAASTVTLSSTIIADNVGRGIYSSATGNSITMTMNTCVFYKNGTANIEFAATSAVGGIQRMTNSVIYGSTDGIKNAISGNATLARQFVEGNAYGGQSGSARVNFTAGGNEVALSADPFVDGDNGNFALNATAGGGAALRDVAFPTTFPGGTTANYQDVGAAQAQSSAGASQSSHSY